MCSITALSRSFAAAMVTWPPSPASATQLEPTGIKPEAPNPEPGPSTAIGRPSTGAPPPTGTRSAADRRGKASATAVKSLIATSRSKPSRSRNATSEKRQG